MKKIVSVVGARPNFVKVAPFLRAITKFNQHAERSSGLPLQSKLVHTGQHYDANLSDTLFESLGIPTPDLNLGIGSGSHASQVGMTMIAFEKVIQAERPDCVVVFGDVNATMACAITAKKEGVPVAHVEAGLRSRDMSMPEEINRIVTDRLSDLLFTTDEFANNNLIAEGMPRESIHLVGNIMIDTFVANRQKAAAITVADVIARNSLFEPADRLAGEQSYAIVTLHRPSNVDVPEVLVPLVEFLTQDVASVMPIIWPIHPRTIKKLEEFGLLQRLRKKANVILLQPLSYLDFLSLNIYGKIIFTDSGGLQEESCLTGTPCITLRFNTERPITLIENGGVCKLAGNSIIQIRQAFNEMKNTVKIPRIPPLWDGQTAVRIVDVIVNS